MLLAKATGRHMNGQFSLDRNCLIFFIGKTTIVSQIELYNL
jgi:hypothetical protein